MRPVSPSSLTVLKAMLTEVEEMVSSLVLGKEVESSGSAEVKFQSSSPVVTALPLL